MRWIVGDIQGCARELGDLLDEVRFDPGRDELWCLGDMINRGPDSLAVMRLWRDVRGRAVIGNHEVDALLAHSGTRPRKLRNLKELFEFPDASVLMERLRDLPLLEFLPSAGKGPDVWAVHAGVDPRWADLEGLAAEVNGSPHDDAWLQSAEVDFATNVRCCTREGRRWNHTGPPEDCSEPYRPWDSLYRGGTLIVHGHWAARGHYRGKRTLGLDSGCVYGGKLTAWCQEEDRIVQVPARGKG